MTELSKEGCREIGTIENGERILSRDILLTINNVNYVITVGTTEYFENLIEHRKKESLPPPSATDVFILSDVSTLEDICGTLHSLPFAEIQSYCVPQEK